METKVLTYWAYVTLAVVFLNIVVVRIFGEFSWNYSVVFVPLWIMNTLLLTTSITNNFNIKILTEPKWIDEQRLQLDNNSESRFKKFKESVLAFRPIITIALVTAIEIQIAKKANNPLDETLLTAATLYTILEAINLCDNIISYFQDLCQGSFYSRPYILKFGFNVGMMWCTVNRFSFVVAIAVRLEGLNDVPWVEILTLDNIANFVIPLAYIMVGPGYAEKTRRQENDPEELITLTMIMSVFMFFVLFLGYMVFDILDRIFGGHSYLLILIIVLSMLSVCSVSILLSLGYKVQQRK